MVLQQSKGFTVLNGPGKDGRIGGGRSPVVSTVGYGEEGRGGGNARRRTGGGVHMTPSVSDSPSRVTLMESSEVSVSSCKRSRDEETGGDGIASNSCATESWFSGAGLLGKIVSGCEAEGELGGFPVDWFIVVES